MTSQKLEQQTTNVASAIDFSVVIAATAPVVGGGLVHAVTVVQPVQTWSVIRGQGDFTAVAESLSQTIPGLPPCPSDFSAEDFNDINSIVHVRNGLQQWLSTALLYPEARSSPAMQSFLTYAINMIPPQYENVPWTIFTANGQVASPSPGPQAAEPVVDDSISNLDDMMMDEMFDGGDDIGVGPLQDESDDEDEYRASERYAPLDEPITEEDEMDIANAIAGEFEMIDDIGSLAQSLGASHLGRSLLLQEQMMTPQNSQLHPGEPQISQQTGLQLGRAISGGGSGGIGSAMELALHQPPPPMNNFNRPVPEGPPRLDSFKMIKVIGKGSFGKVFLVKENQSGSMFALKVLRKDNIIRRNQVEHTKTERSVLGYVKHPFIVGMNMAFQSRDKLYFVLDYCAGGELFFHLGKVGHFPVARTRFYAAEIILAISYVHSLDIIYRDLKPENVLLDASGHIRLTDFGLSKEGISNSSSGANSFCGTPEYLAPEILNRQGHGRAVDWWSLGALTYEMLTGLPPFYCQDRERLFEKIRKSDLNYPASLSSSSKNLLRGLLTKDPVKRLGSGPKDAEEIKPHSFFDSIDWDKLSRGEVTPPWKPKISGTQDTSQFDKEFTSMPIFSPQSMQRAPGFGSTPLGDNPFEGFTFQDRTILQGP
ncbi:serine/threonine protein kinase [Nitzschia inconspicua]|uniref:Serine/threonine protein kinase n=1 Tax=Nitzschia inconspicua TaxID=303405 RepID=A0A9K3LM92_9STRA|nr:serine/threonine protein kinase [Nitzschia inconspicua]